MNTYTILNVISNLIVTKLINYVGNILNKWFA